MRHALLAALLSCAPVAHAADAVRVESPDASIRLGLAAPGGRLTHEVTLGGRPAIERSRLGIVVDGVDLGEGAAIGRVERYQIEESYPWRGVHSTAVNRCRGARITLRHGRTGTGYTLEARACDDGSAFRFVVPGAPGQSRVPDAATTFRLPAGSVAWFHGLNAGHYEDLYARKAVEEVQNGEWAAPPVTFRLPGGRGYGSITEAALSGYAGMALQADGRGGFDVRLAHDAPASYPFRLRYGLEEEKRLAVAAPVEGTITTPWRVVMIGRDLHRLVNSDVVHNLAPPPDPELFPQGLATPWLRPGRAVWRYLDGGENTFEGIKEFSRLAAELGFEYNLVEGLWQRWSEAELRELVEYSKARNVGIWLWRHSRTLRDPGERRQFFRMCRDVGAVGVKADFLDHEAKEVIAVYQDILRDAAEHRLMVDFHGANKPTGETRTWPNEMTREAVRGLEYRRTEAWAEHNATLPFTRYLAGPADYTPMVFGERRKETSWAHQIATAAVFTSPLLVYGAHPASILAHPARELIRDIPSVWDETRVLAPSAIGEVAVFARRSGERWFLAVVNGPGARTIRVPLSFLGKASHRALLVRDKADDPAAVQVEERDVTPRDVLEIALRPGGGFVGRLSPGPGPVA